MAELMLQPESKPTRALGDSSRTGRRASDMGILPMSLDSYVRLLDWTARMLRSGDRSTIPKDLASAIIALLMGIMMPALARVRQMAYRMLCGTNLSGLGKVMLIYANDND
ncbi:MAG: hypothetical protein R6U98_29210, partial [Pirellulaceae bacterium]